MYVVIVASVWFLRSKSQDELDKKANNHLPLPMDYASNEGKLKNHKKYGPYNLVLLVSILCTMYTQLNYHFMWFSVRITVFNGFTIIFTYTCILHMNIFFLHRWLYISNIATLFASSIIII